MQAFQNSSGLEFMIKLLTQLTGTAIAQRKGHLRLRLVAATAVAALAVLGIGLLLIGPAIWAIPTRVPLMGTPADLGLSYESVTFPAADQPIELSAWWIEAEGSKAAVILGHGVVSNKSFPWTNRSELLKSLVGLGYSVLALDHRGHGESEASQELEQPYGAPLAYDFIGGVDFIRARNPDLAVVIVGYSSSGSASLYAAAWDKRIAGVVSECTAAEERSVLLSEIPRITPVPSLLAPALLWVAEHFYGLRVEMMRAIDAVESISPRPVFLIHTRDDLIVPVSHAYQLAAKGPSTELWVAGAPPSGTQAHELYTKGRNHCRTFYTYPDIYVRRLASFIERAIGEKGD